jgi:hypothetical protein
MLSVRMEKPDTAYVTFRETNDVDPANGGLVYGFLGTPHPSGSPQLHGPFVAAAGNGRVHTMTFTGVLPSITYCFTG